MNAEKIQIKLFAKSKTGVAIHPSAFVPVFHEWIRNTTLPELMIDVATYEHVAKGPSVLFVGHGSDYVIDEHKGAPGLLYNRKRAFPGASDRLSDAVRRALFAASLLQKDGSLNVLFRTDEILFRINDRLSAPNTAATFAALRPELESYFSALLTGLTLTVEHVADDPRELFTVRIRVADVEKAPSIDALLERAGGRPV
jgi:hypothetical protein